MVSGLAEGLAPGRMRDGPAGALSIPRRQLRRRNGNRMNMKRMRGRGHRPGGGGGGGGGPRYHGGSSSGGIPLNRNHVFDSNGPDIRVRGTAQQLFEKYLQLGRDATSGGDRVTAESYFQHAEHYFRILNAISQAQQQAQQANGQRRPFNGEDGAQAPSEGEEGEARAPGTGEQPEAREIPIAAAPPEA